MREEHKSETSLSIGMSSIYEIIALSEFTDLLKNYHLVTHTWLINLNLQGSSFLSIKMHVLRLLKSL